MIDIEEIEQLFVQYGETYMMGDAQDFLDFLRRTAEADAMLITLEYDADDQSKPVDLFGVAGVIGLADPAEVAALEEQRMWDEDTGPTFEEDIE